MECSELDAISQPKVYNEGDVIDLHFLFQALWRKKLWILLATAIGLTWGIRNLANFVPVYEARLIISPINTTAPSDFSGSSAQFSSIAKALGVGEGLGEEQPTSFDRLQIALSSVTLAKEIEAEHKLLRRIFSGWWDDNEQKWVRPTGARFNFEQRLKKLLKLETWEPPSTETLAEYLGSTITINELEDLPFKEIIYRSADRELALDMLQTVYFSADEYVRAQERIETKERQNYLEAQLSRETVVDKRSVLITLLSRVEYTLMLLEGSLPYAAQIVEKPYVSKKSVPPNLILLVAVPTILGFALAIVVVSLLVVFRQESR